ncbi:Concanavalin A-like lectin/glucanase, subgroup [Cynara cardunculus var. scolymus]|uniref:Concanavalin A-like lectin/glucanase, subgroup n=1 Tax=Cynara cardunculus var. scolymus TaxID=59895 RepID=A0A103Y2N3_CYNCS|nr:Concanavalin A-like lectin/glucanase, subgroup [Cynara cardunculus var. scolymus]
MIQSAPTKILIGISFDQERSMELLSSAICNLARPNDTVVALHVLVAQTTKKHTDKRGVSKSINRYRTRIRKAKAFVISVTGEFANVCRAKQVKLEARVGFSSSVGKGLVEEAKNMSSRVHQTQKYCLDNSPKSCSIVLVQKSDMKKQDFHSGNINEEDFSNKKSEQRSPRNVLDLSERDYHSTEEDSSSFEGSSIMESPPPLVARKSKGQSSFRKHISSLKRISSFLRSPFEPDTRKADMKLPIKEQQQTLLKCLSYEELAKATNNFHPDNIVGIGGYSEVYKGDLENGQVIAVKKLAKDNKDQNKEKEFLMELGILGHINHPNTASLVGCCVENGLYLIFNYYPNGTLSSALHGKTGKHIEWPERYKIAVGIARGLHYLHTCCKHRIIHRDIKASNVLLGPDFEPQAKPLMDSRDICRLIDPDLEGEYDSDQLYRLVLTSSYCVQQSSDWRPSMTEVLEVLQHGDDSEFAKSWRIPEFTQEENEMDDYSMIFGYDVPSDISLDDI